MTDDTYRLVHHDTGTRRTIKDTFGVSKNGVLNVETVDGQRIWLGPNEHWTVKSKPE